MTYKSKDITVKDFTDKIIRLDNDIVHLTKTNEQLLSDLNLLLSCLNDISKRTNCTDCIHYIGRLNEDYCKHLECIGVYDKYSSKNHLKVLAKEAINSVKR